ncbi:pseudouridine synthase [Foetidibacter luteolus]|uniref:pseudouridine synthase n=1 Tax=Foetidibacter luteolus TaxID=2608880 RepID=UPI001F45DB38|nr:pseudouridine synthase [Foetidibacter luteolus]
MAKHAFDKFMNKEATGAKKKEALRQEKRKAKAQLRAEGEEFRRKKLEKLRGIENKEQGTRKREIRIDKKGDRSNFSPARKEKPERNFNAADKKSSYPAKQPANTFKKEADRPPFTKPAAPKPSRGAHHKTSTDKPRYKQGKPVAKSYDEITQKPATHKQAATDEMPLNKYIAHSGVCGRREAAEMVKEGKVQVNGSIVYEPGYKVTATDKVLVKGKQVHLQKNLVYVLLNKPKDYLTTSDDPQGRKTVLELVKEATQERIYPIGRLDRNTTGVLLLTNDGELAQKLTHPSYEIKKLYEVTLDKPLVKKDAESILTGITLEDGQIKADELGYADTKDKSVIGIQIHSGRNRIVRRIFEHLGYKVKNLDRVMFANLTKKNVERGKWRFLNEKEVRLLKYMNQSFVKKSAQ